MRTLCYDSEGTTRGVAQRRRLGQAIAGLVLLAAGAGAFAQSPVTGSLSGKLTDLHSKPLDGATVILRNTATGREARTTSARNGAYRFVGLEPGEYSLEAANSGPDSGPGHGQLRGIYISAGHEARMQAAVGLEPAPRESLASQAPVPMAVPPLSAAQDATTVSKASPAAPIPNLPKPTADKPTTLTPTLEARLDPEPARILPLAATSPAEPRLKVRPIETAAVSTPVSTPGAASEKFSDPELLPESVQHRQSEVPLLAPAVPIVSLASIHAAEVPDLSSSLAVVAATPPALRGMGMGFAVAAVCGAQGAAQLQQAFPVPRLTVSRTIEPESIAPAASLSSEQLQALPLQGRHWEDFVLDTPVRRGGQGVDTPDTALKSERTAVSVTVDGAGTRLAFGGRGGGTMRSASLMGPGGNESAIGEVRTLETGGDTAAGRNAGLETRGGSNGLHGQGFLFDRQNFLGAQNPFTQWVKETVPATVTSVPVFSPVPYTAPDRAFLWGAGVGSRIPHSRLFWFAAFDGTHRDYPGVAMVKHPGNFFAQPTNDEMQVLSARLGLPSANPVGEGLGAYSGMLETLSGLLGPAPRTADQWVAPSAVSTGRRRNGIALPWTEPEPSGIPPAEA